MYETDEPAPAPLYFRQLLHHGNHLHNAGPLNPYFSNCNHRSQKFIRMAHEIRDEETALCMQIKSAYIPEYNDEKEKKKVNFQMCQREIFKTYSHSVTHSDEFFRDEICL